MKPLTHSCTDSGQDVCTARTQRASRCKNPRTHGSFGRKHFEECQSQKYISKLFERMPSSEAMAAWERSQVELAMQKSLEEDVAFKKQEEKSLKRIDKRLSALKLKRVPMPRLGACQVESLVHTAQLPMSPLQGCKPSTILNPWVIYVPGQIRIEIQGTIQCLPVAHAMCRQFGRRTRPDGLQPCAAKRNLGHNWQLRSEQSHVDLFSSRNTIKRLVERTVDHLLPARPSLRQDSCSLKLFAIRVKRMPGLPCTLELKQRSNSSSCPDQTRIRQRMDRNFL